MCEKPKRTLIKICGLTTEQDVVYANTFLPDFAGFVLFYPKSRRNLDLPAAAALRRIECLHVSISHETDWAIAFAVAE